MLYSYALTSLLFWNNKGEAGVWQSINNSPAQSPSHVVSHPQNPAYCFVSIFFRTCYRVVLTYAFAAVNSSIHSGSYRSADMGLRLWGLVFETAETIFLFLLKSCAHFVSNVGVAVDLIGRQIGSSACLIPFSTCSQLDADITLINRIFSLHKV